MAKRPRDPGQLAKQVFDIAIGEAEDTVSESKRHPSKRRVGGLLGGKARAKSLTAEKRRKIARKAARARWKVALRCTPSMAAGLSDHLWSLEDMVHMIDSYMPKPGKRGPYKEKTV